MGDRYQNRNMHLNGMFDGGTLVKQAIPADNSCLFTSIRFCLNGYLDNESSANMRYIVAQEIVRNKREYTSAVLGSPIPDYCSWIQKLDSWGGAIEIAILSNFYNIEIDVVDIQNRLINRFGENRNYERRIFILFNGSHYDALFMKNITTNCPVTTIFPLGAMNVYRQAEIIAQRGNLMREQRNTETRISEGVSNQRYRCLDCDALILGPNDAKQHTNETGHKRFSEV